MVCRIVEALLNELVPALGETAAMAWPMPWAAPVTSATRPVWGSEVLLAGMSRPLCECGPIGAYEATVGLSTSSHHWRKLVGVEFSGVRWTPLSRPSFFAQAMSVYP